MGNQESTTTTTTGVEYYDAATAAAPGGPAGAAAYAAGNPYAVLGVAPNASQDEIRQAYMILSRTYHPDSNSRESADLRLSREERIARCAEINHAYEVLRTPELRRRHDGGYAREAETLKSDFADQMRAYDEARPDPREYYRAEAEARDRMSGEHRLMQLMVHQRSAGAAGADVPAEVREDADWFRRAKLADNALGMDSVANREFARLAGDILSPDDHGYGNVERTTSTEYSHRVAGVNHSRFLPNGKKIDADTINVMFDMMRERENACREIVPVDQLESISAVPNASGATSISCYDGDMIIGEDCTKKGYDDTRNPGRPRYGDYKASFALDDEAITGLAKEVGDKNDFHRLIAERAMKREEDMRPLSAQETQRILRRRESAFAREVATMERETREDFDRKQAEMYERDAAERRKLVEMYARYQYLE